VKNYEQVDISLVYANDWNPNEMDDREFSMLIDNIKRIGFADPVTVVRDGERYRIIDGEHRYRAALLTGMSKLPVIVIDLSDEDQRKQTVRLNNIKGDWNPLKFNKLVSEMLGSGELDIGDAAYELGFSNPSDFHLLRNLMAESLPTGRSRSEFKEKSKSATSSGELYALMNRIMAKVAGSDEGGMDIMDVGGNQIWLLSNKALVGSLLELQKQLRKKRRGRIEDILLQSMQSSVGCTP